MGDLKNINISLESAELSFTPLSDTQMSFEISSEHHPDNHPDNHPEHPSDESLSFLVQHSQSSHSSDTVTNESIQSDDLQFPTHDNSDDDDSLDILPDPLPDVQNPNDYTPLIPPTHSSSGNANGPLLYPRHKFENHVNQPDQKSQRELFLEAKKTFTRVQREAQQKLQAGEEVHMGKFYYIVLILLIIVWSIRIYSMIFDTDSHDQDNLKQ
ncbi:MAG: hypothetical protein Sylvanvirus4_9 [Sylvanvirus sp.]|uniref:Uncharacterized protein n=1 Tax=Sylvanvirus sp. TaxID=2487774 RepID=A0A3G5AHB0_9VIRU|nr:MAG: hypothetical protein Sylvanvirus4_9 [Sylvanvirus sp.]